MYSMDWLAGCLAGWGSCCLGLSREVETVFPGLAPADSQVSNRYVLSRPLHLLGTNLIHAHQNRILETVCSPWGGPYVTIAAKPLKCEITSHNNYYMFD